MLRNTILMLVASIWLVACAAGGDSGLPASRKLTTQELAKWIDERLAGEYERVGVTGASTVDDATFLRRIYVDLQGRIPTVAQVRDFLADEGSFKRQDYVDRLQNDGSRQDRFAARTAEHLARVWRRMMVPASSPGAALATRLDPWLAKQFAENTPYDQLAQKLMLATPPAMTRPIGPPATVAADPETLAGVFQQAVGPSPENLTSAYVRVFLGVRLSCAQCHDHPFTTWKQRDFWGMAAFFAAEAAGSNDKRPPPSIVPQGDQSVTYVAKLLWNEQPLTELPAAKSPREVLAEWMVSADNPNFAATAVNRIWQYLCGRGLVGSVDDLDRVTAEERRMLDDLAKLFSASGHDVRWLITGICKSKVYQQTIAAEAEASDGFVRRPLKTLLPEQVFDSLEQALSLPIGKADHGPRFSGERDQFVARMNEAAPETPVDYKGGIPQALMLMNGKLTADATSLDSSRTLRAVVEAPFLPTEQKIETLYLAVLSRRPKPEETQYLLKHLERTADEKAGQSAYAEIMWGLLNSPEFVLCK
jgi:Protein of unknown function (DUF1549)/Protein of unknown function (DUF1553)